MSSGVEVAPKRAADPEHLHDSEEYESAEEIEGEVYEDDEIEEVEVEIEEEEEEEEDEDGQTPVPKEKELDDDEDRKNPQFIPKSGYFYEHDDRTKTNEGEEEEGEEKSEEKPKKVVVKDTDRWTHDRFEEVEQAPKSQDELSAAYGYDIRSEDQPPRARRRRRYGRGPNKYTRKWEEEEAYQKPRGGYRGRGGGSRGGGEGGRGKNAYNNRQNSRGGGYEEDFPELADGSDKKSVERTDSWQGRGGSRRDESQKQENRGRGVWAQDRNERERDHNDRERTTDRDRDYDSGRGGGRGRGNRGGGRGRRNEFTNRNRYPDRRDSFNNNVNPSMGTSSKAREGSNGDKEMMRGDKQDKHWAGHDDRRERPSTNGSTNVEKQSPDMMNSGTSSHMNNNKQSVPQKKITLPFTNTEYTGSASLTTSSNRNVGGNNSETLAVSNSLRMGTSELEFDNISVKVEPESGGKDVRLVRSREQLQPSNEYRERDMRDQRGSGENLRDNRNLIREPPPPRDSRDVRDHRDVVVVPEIRDAREIIRERQAMKQREAMMERQPDNTRDGREREIRDNRDMNRRPPNKGYPNDRRPQMPPRLQQQQQQQQQQQMEQASLAGKTKRFSAQRQRQVESAMVSGGVVPPSAVVSPQLGQNVQPVVTGAGPPVPVYPQPTAYYETAPSGFDAQVYEASASPAAGNGHNHGPSVSPSLWGPHASAYATAPYPSPPTGHTGQVPVPQPPYADPFIAAAQQTGQPIYAPPQFIQDPNIINYAAQGAPFAAPYHPQGFQGYAQVTPAPPPEMYHGGVTYYNTQNQIQRPPMITPLKRPKTVLQLVEPPEKAKETYQKHKELPLGENYSVHNVGATEYYENQNHDQQQQPPPPMESITSMTNYHPELSQQNVEVSTLQPIAPAELKKQRSPSPRQLEIPEKDSWSAQMAELQSPTETDASPFTESATPGFNYSEEAVSESVKREVKSELKSEPKEKSVSPVPPSSSIAAAPSPIPPQTHPSENSKRENSPTAATESPQEETGTKVKVNDNIKEEQISAPKTPEPEIVVSSKEEEIPVIEKEIVKTTTWVCGSSEETPTAESFSKEESTTTLSVNSQETQPKPSEEEQSKEVVEDRKESV